MPWNETCPMKERLAFINDYIHSKLSITQLSKRYRISRKTAYKWIHRYRLEGETGLIDRPRVRLTQGHRTSREVEQQIVQCKQQYHWWGPRPIIDYLRMEYPEMDWPAYSTAGLILKRHGLVKTRRVRKKVPPYTQPLAHADQPNDVWSIDFKGQFKLNNGIWCYPLTISDNTSRYLINCTGMSGIAMDPVLAQCELAFRRYGLPKAIRSDNGYPFASRSLGGLNPLSIWFLKLGVLPERIDPGCPQQNPRHERMHRTLKAATAKPPSKNMAQQQRAFDQFRHDYNELRSHRSLDRTTPSEHYRPSTRRYPERIIEPQYPHTFIVRRVRSSGEFKWRGRLFYANNHLHREPIGLHEIADGMFQIYYGQLAIGIVDERLGKIIRPAKK